MVNQAYLDDKKIKYILIYIFGMRHSEQIRQMLLCAFFGMTDQRDRYKNLLKAFRYTSKIQSLVRGYLK